jgi:hypothetical protein
VIRGIADALLASLRLQKCERQQVESALATAYRTVRTRVNNFQKTNPAAWTKQGLSRTLSGRREAVSAAPAKSPLETYMLKLCVCVCVCVCVCAAWFAGQKLRLRMSQLKKIGGAGELISRAKAKTAAWTLLADPTLLVLVNFLMSRDAHDFHSDDDEESLGTDGRVKVTLRHTFRSQCATDILRELDASGVSEASPRQSDREGTELSVSKAVKLLLLVELEPLYRKEVVSIVAARRKRKTELPSEQDDFVEQTDNRLVTSYISDIEAVPAELI